MSSWRSRASTARIAATHDNKLEDAMRLHAAATAATLALFCAGTADAAEITLLSSNAVKTAVEELVPQFEKASEHKLKITFGAAANLKAQIEKGEAFDVAILTASGI